MNPIIASIGLPICCNVFVTFAWYAHLKELNYKTRFIATLISWGVALFEHLLQVPANRIGCTAMNIGQLKIVQEVLRLSVFATFSVIYLKEPLKLDYLWAGLRLPGALFFIFRFKLGECGPRPLGPQVPITPLPPC